MIFPVDSAGLVRRTLTAGGNRIPTLSVPPSRDRRRVDLAATAPRFVAAGVRPHPQFLRRPSRILILPMFRTGDAPPRWLDNFEHHVRPASSPTGDLVMLTRRTVMVSALASAVMPPGTAKAADEPQTAAPTVLRLIWRTLEVNGKPASVYGIRQPDGTPDSLCRFDPGSVPGF